MAKWICLNCLKEHELNPIYENEEYIIKGKKVVITALKAKCPCCGEYMENDDITESNLQSAYTTYRQEEKLLSPDEIKKIRKKYGATQVAFSIILGVGDKTIARYEGGALQDAAPNNLIVLMKNRENFIKLWQLNKSKLDPKENEAIESALGYKAVSLQACTESYYPMPHNFFSNIFSQPSLTFGGTPCRT